MKLTVVSKDPPGGRCTLYTRYAEAVAEGRGAEVEIVYPAAGGAVDPPALLVDGRLIAPGDGLILSPMDVYTGLSALGIPVTGLLARLEQVEHSFMEGLSS